MPAQPLGQILLEKNLITAQQLRHALSLQKQSGGRLGDILISEGAVNYHALYQAVAWHFGVPYVNLLENPPDSSLLDPRLASAYVRRRIIPYKKEGDTVILATSEFSDEGLAFARQIIGGPVEFACTSPFDIRRAVEKTYAKEMELHSRLWLWHKHPDASARRTLLDGQRIFIHCLLLALAVLTIVFPTFIAFFLFAFCHVLYAVTMLFKLIVFSHGAASPTEWDWKKHFATLDEESLPTYTILLPMYQEKESLPGLLKAMQALDYPASKLDIKLVLEADDRVMYEAAQWLKPRHQFEIIRVPPGEPRTKPRACNYALQFARGEFITIYDADDRPDKKQLKKAVAAFKHLPPDVVCLQARLNYFNANENLLTRFFSLEYSVLFHFMLYGLQRLNMPIPLGGTSNHMALARLKELGEWDPYNVTEDADLGTRLAAKGYKTAMLDSYTMEEAPTTVWPWIKQRSRWIKGYMQTWLVHMRHPRQLYLTLGLKSFIGFQCFIGLPGFTFLTAPLVWTASILWIGQIAHWHHIVLPEWLIWLTAINLVINFFTLWYQALYSAWSYRVYAGPIMAAALLYPFYMVLHTLASYRALWQLIVNPHFWDKTTHGVAKILYQAGAKPVGERQNSD